MSLLTVKNVKKVYTTRFGTVRVQALNDVNFSVEEGEYVAIMGESGSGKTTLLNILASLDTATSGQVLLNGQEISRVSQKDLCAFRRDHLGFVFQDFNLLDTMSLRDNIFLPLVLAGCRIRRWRRGCLLFQGSFQSKTFWINIPTRCREEKSSGRLCAGL